MTATSTVTSTVIVPIGLAMGRDVTAAPEGGEAPFEVRLGATPAALGWDEMLVWAATFLDPERHADRPAGRAGLVAKLRDGAGLSTDPEQLVSRLIQRGLLLEYDPAGDLEALFSRWRLLPLAQGYGNSAAQPDRYGIGFAGRTLIDVNPETYAIWSYSFAEPSLWDACAALAAGFDSEVTADEIARDVATALPLLVVTGCAVLEPASGRQP